MTILSQFHIEFSEYLKCQIKLNDFDKVADHIMGKHNLSKKQFMERKECTRIVKAFWKNYTAAEEALYRSEIKTNFGIKYDDSVIFSGRTVSGNDLPEAITLDTKVLESLLTYAHTQGQLCTGQMNASTNKSIDFAKGLVKEQFNRLHRAKDAEIVFKK